MGTFDAERFWREPNLAKLPAFHDPGMANIVSVMDELLFPLCSEQDMLVTRLAMNVCHKDYLHSVGFQFDSNQTDIEPLTDGDISTNVSVFELLLRSGRKEEIKRYLPSGAMLLPFAVLPFVDHVAAEYDLGLQVPSLDTIRKVNSKLYSVELSRQLTGSCYSQVVVSQEELLKTGKKLLSLSSFLIKDECGVSGKGNLLVDSEAILHRMAAYIGNQEQKGKDVRFILEPFLDKESDFSFQFHIDPNGHYSFISVQRLLNQNFAYLGSVTAEPPFVEMLQEAGYFEQMKQVACELYNSGYYGHVCVDSMVLRDGEIIPIVEVNARSSMSLIKHYIDRNLAKHGLQCSMTHVTVQFTEVLEFAELLEVMDREGILYTPSRGGGILPLSANTLFINKSISQSKGVRNKPVKGRFYFSVVSQRQEVNGALLARAKELLTGLSFRIVN